MSTTTVPRAADVASAASSAVHSLTDEQILAILRSSHTASRQVLPGCWDAIKAAAPDLALVLDELHASETATDLARFEALAAGHEKQMDKAATSPAGKVTAGLVFAALTLGVLTAILWLTGAALPFLLAGSALSGALLLGGFTAGARLARRSGNWLVADPEAAASIVWDAGIDAAAAAALQPRTGQDGLTPDVLDALSAVWSGAGLDTVALTPQP